MNTGMTMKMLRSISRAGVLCVGILLGSCGGKNSNDIDSCGDIRQEYIVDNYTASLVRYDEPIDDLSIAKIPKLIANNENVAWNMFAIDLNANFQTYTVKHQPAVRFNLFAQALACSPYIHAKQALSKISITSANTFNDSYPAGSELASLFATLDYPSVNVSALADLGKPAPRWLKLKLLEAPQYSQQNFEVEISLNDGNVFILKTGDVYFTVP